MRGGLFAGLLIITLALGFTSVGCDIRKVPGDPGPSESYYTPSSYRTIEHEGYTFEINSDWVEEVTSQSSWRYYEATAPGDSNYAFVAIQELDTTFNYSTTTDEQLEMLRLTMNIFAPDPISIEEGLIGANASITAEYLTHRAGEPYLINKALFFFVNPDLFVMVICTSPVEQYCEYRDNFEFIVGSISVE